MLFSLSLSISISLLPFSSMFRSSARFSRVPRFSPLPLLPPAPSGLQSRPTPPRTSPSGSPSLPLDYHPLSTPWPLTHLESPRVFRLTCALRVRKREFSLSLSFSPCRSFQAIQYIGSCPSPRGGFCPCETSPEFLRTGGRFDKINSRRGKTRKKRKRSSFWKGWDEGETILEGFGDGVLMEIRLQELLVFGDWGNDGMMERWKVGRRESEL